MSRTGVLMGVVVMLDSLTVGSSSAMSLTEKAQIFQTDLEHRFEIEGQVACKLKLPTPERDFVAYNMPDNTYMTGIYVATLAMQYAVTGEKDVRKKGRTFLTGLDRLCRITGKPWLPARAFLPIEMPWQDDGVWRESPDGQYRWRGDVSTDQLTGLFFGYHFAQDLLAGPLERERMSQNCREIVGGLIDHRLQIEGYDGRTTTWGRYDKEYVTETEPLNALLFLQHLLVAREITEHLAFGLLYNSFLEQQKYGEIAQGARKHSEVNHSDDVLLFLAVVPLLETEKSSGYRSHFLEAFRNAWEGTDTVPGLKSERNPCFAFAAARYLDCQDGVASGVETLQRFPLDLKWNQETIDSYAAEFGFRLEASESEATEDPDLAPPIDQRPRTWSAWVANPFETGSRTDFSPLEYNGHDYLLAYWLGRHWGYIGPDE